MFQKNKSYKRLEIERAIDPNRQKCAQGSYYKIKGTDSGVSFVKLVSPYKNEISGDKAMVWQDSIGQKATPGEEFLNSINNIYLFVENPTKGENNSYYFVGKIDKSTVKMIEIGEFRRIPNTFRFEFEEEISNKVKALFGSAEISNKNQQIKEEAATRAFGVIDPTKAAEIGKCGEEIFNQHLSEQKHSYFDVMKLLDGAEKEQFIWLNKNGESGKPYDFVVDKAKIDVKTTITSSERFYLSQAEHELVRKGELNIVLMFIDEEWRYKKHKVLTSQDVANMYDFEVLKYLAKPKAE